MKYKSTKSKLFLENTFIFFYQKEVSFYEELELNCLLFQGQEVVGSQGPLFLHIVPNLDQARVMTAFIKCTIEQQQAHSYNLPSTTGRMF